jgi:hypothetical protein
VAHFGGNPESVTLLGHGQGAGLVTAMTAVEAADGLFRRVWASNGAGRYDCQPVRYLVAVNHFPHPKFGKFLVVIPPRVVEPKLGFRFGSGP